MKLIVAEKPSVAASISTIVGSTIKQKGYYEGSSYYVSYCIGHLVRLAMPEEYEAPGTEKSSWSLDKLPILPETIKNIPVSDTLPQFKILVKLMQQSDVSEIICATDSAREGELIFRRIYELSGSTKPVKRLWVSSSEPEAYRAALAALKPSTEYDNLYLSGYCRAVADWLVGINCTQGYSALYKTTLPIGRVKTPVLGFVVARENEIQAFCKKKYYRLTAAFDGFKAFANVDTSDTAQKIVFTCTGKTANVVKAVTETKTQLPPLLYNTSDMMVDANNLFGYPADHTLRLLQSLYDKKYTTYPRVSSNYITSDMKSVVLDRASALAKRLLSKTNGYQPVLPARLVNDKKSEEHYALLPTETAVNADVSTLSPDELNVFYLVAYRLLCALHSPYIYDASKLELEVSGYTFNSTGRIVLEEGYKGIERLYLKPSENADTGDATEKDLQILPPLSVGDEVFLSDIKVDEKETQPPKRYTDATLIRAMENAGRNIAEVNLKKALHDCGLGTEATRAEIVSSLMKNGFADRKGRYILPTEKGCHLIEKTNPALVDPLLTAQWEEKLDLIKNGKYRADDFLFEIKQFVMLQIEQLRSLYRLNGQEPETAFHHLPGQMVGACPRCGKFVYENKKAYSCENRTCGFILWKDNSFSRQFKKELTTTLVKKLLFNKVTPVKGLTSKAGKKFDCKIQLEDTGKYVNIRLVFD